MDFYEKDGYHFRSVPRPEEHLPPTRPGDAPLPPLHAGTTDLIMTLLSSLSRSGALQDVTWINCSTGHLVMVVSSETVKEAIMKLVDSL
jgi:hypothetical protein